MHYYMEITCLQDEGISAAFVMGKVMDILHLSMVKLEKQLGVNPVGISFPEYKSEEGKPPVIGSKVRLFSQNESHLEMMDLKRQLNRLEDYIHTKKAREIDRPNLSFAIFKRVQMKSSKERLVRRQMKRKGISEEEARKQYQTFGESSTSLPFVHMRSHSNTQKFRLFINKQTAEPSENWVFNTYGLSASIPVPDF